METLFELLDGFYQNNRLLYALITVLSIGTSGTLFALLMKTVTRNTVLAEDNNAD